MQFVGREDALTQVHKTLQAGATVAISSVSGMGGVGKTELALQYALQHGQTRTYPGGICWLNARAQDVGLGLLGFARTQLQLPDPPDSLQTVREQVQWVCRHWQGEPILVVVDDVTDYAAIKPYLAALDTRFRVLLTTRLQLGAPVQSVELEVLTPASALELLGSLVEQPDRINRQREDAQQLCHWLGYLPLGLELVGRYLARHPDLSMAAMLQRLRDQTLAAKALVQPAAEMTAPLGVAAAFALSWQELSPAARSLSGLLSLFALAPIPWELVTACLPDWDQEDQETRRDELVYRSLLTRVGEQRYELHQLIREFFASKLTTDLSLEAPSLQRAVATCLTDLAKTIPPTPTLGDIQRVQAAIPHLEAVATHLTDHLAEEDCTWPFTGLARFYQGQSLWPQAEQWHLAHRRLAETRQGADHPDTASSLNNLALLYYAMGRYGEAEPLYARCLEIFLRVLGQDHPSTQTVFNNFVTCLQAAVAQLATDD